MLKNKKFKLRFLLIFASVLLMLLTTGFSVALFSSSKEATSNFTIGKIEIENTTNLTFSSLTKVLPGATVVNDAIQIAKNANSSNMFVRASFAYSSTGATQETQNFISKLNEINISTFSNASYEWKKFENDKYFYLVQKGTNTLFEISTNDAINFTSGSIKIPLNVDEINGTGADSPTYNKEISANFQVQAIQSFQIASTHSATSAIFNETYNKTLDTQITGASANGKIILNGIVANQDVSTKTNNYVNGTESTMLITPVPDEGYNLSTFTVGGINKTLSNGCYTHTLNSTASANKIVASFAKNNYILTVGSTTNGTVSPANGTSIAHGSNQVITLTPNSGYTVASFTIDGESKVENLKLNPNGTYTYTIENVLSSHTVAASFTAGVEIRTNVLAGKGTIVASKIVNAKSTITITPEAGYLPTLFTINGTNKLSSLVKNASGAFIFVLTSITQNTLANVSFEQGISISTSAGIGGSVFANPSVVSSGGSSTVTILPNIGYQITAITKNGSSVSSFTKTGHTISLTNITTAQSVSATFSPLPYAMTTIVGAGTTLSLNPSTSTINVDQQVKITAGLSTGYKNLIVKVYKTGDPSTVVSVFNNSFAMPAYAITVESSATTSTFTIAFNGNGSTSGSTASISATYNSTATLTANGFSKTGYTFQGWSTTSGATSATFTNSDALTVAEVNALYPNANGGTKTLYAVWKANTFTIAFNGNGATSGSTASKTATYDSTATLTANGFSKTGYTFQGWSTTSGATSATYTNSDALTVAEVNALYPGTNGSTKTLYAVWKANPDTPYAVKHYQMNLDGSTYTLYSTDNKTGTTDALTNATANTYSGFTAQTINQLTIEADASTVVPVYYLRNKYNLSLVSGAGISSNEITFLDYIQCENNYFDTGVLIDSNTKVILDYETIDNKTGVWLYGSRTGGGSTNTFGVFLNTTSQFWAQIGGNTGTSGGYFNETVTGRHTIDVSGTRFIYDGVQKGTYSNTLTTGTYNLILGSIHSGGTIDGRYFQGKIYSFKVYSGDSLVRDFIPVQKGTEIGLYDVINGVFYTGSGNGPLVAGPATSGSVLYGQSVKINADVSGGYTWSKWNSSNTSILAHNSTQNATIIMPAGAIILTATATPNTFTIAFNGNGATSGSTASKTATYDSTATLTANGFSKTGYTFQGWATSFNATSATYTNSDALTVAEVNALYQYSNDGTKTLYAVWTANTNTPYAVKHYQEKMDIASPSTATASHWDLVTADTQSLTGTTDTSVTPAVKTYTGFTSPSTQTVTINGAGTTVVSYYYTRNSYTITTVAGTGIASVSPATGAQDYGKALTLTATLSAGYSTPVWTKTSGAGTLSGTTFTVGAGVATLTASATLITYNVAFNANGGTGAPANQTKSYGINLTLSSTKPTYSGYVFIGWGTSSSATTATYQPGGTYSANSAITLYAVWADVSFASSTQSKTYGDSAFTIASTTKVGSTAITSGFTTAYSSSATSVATVNASTGAVTIVGKGSTVITATITANGQTDTATYTLTVSTKTITGTATISGTVQYGSTLTASVASGISGATYSYQWQSATTSTGTYSNISGATANTYTIPAEMVGKFVKVVITGTNNFSGTLTSSATSAISKIALTGTWSGGSNLTYNGSSQTYAGTVALSGMVNSENPTFSYSGKTGTTVGTYTASVALTSLTDRYTLTSTKSWQITQKAASIVFKAGQSATYTGSAMTFGATSFYTITGFAESVTAVSYTANPATVQNVGQYTITPTGITGPTVSNYSITYTANTFTITSAGQTVVVAGYEGIYDGSAHYATIKMTIPASATVRYSTTSGNYSAYTLTATTSVANFANVGRTTVGTTTIYYQVTAANYTTITGSVTIIINKATPTITTLPTANAIAKGQALSASTLTGGVASVAGTFAWTTSSTVPTATGNQSVTFTPTDTANYNTTTGSVNVTVNQIYIIFNKNNSSATGTMANQAFNYNESKALTNNAYALTGYTFQGWATSANGSVIYSNGATYKLQSTSNVNLYAKWTANTNTAYTIKHYQEKMDIASPITATASHWDLVTADTQSLTGTTDTSVTPAVKTYTGFTSPSTQTVTINGAGTTVVSYYYTRNAYTITTVAGTGIASVSPATGAQDFGKVLTLSSTLSAGYSTPVWAKTSGAGTLSGTTFTVGAGVATLTASATLNTSTIKLGTLSNITKVEYSTSSTYGSGTWTQLTTAGFSANANTNYYFYATLASATGYTIAFSAYSGWFTDSTQTSGAKNFTTNGSTYTINATASKTAHTFTIAFNGNGSTSGSTASKTATYDSTATLTANGFVKTGYTFQGWATTSGATSATYTNNDALTVAEVNALYPNANGGTKTLYAVWKINTYSITFVAGANGTVSPSGAQTINYGDSISSTATANSGYAFTGWTRSGSTNTVSALTGAELTVSNVSVVETFTANFVATYTITWKNHDGTTLETDSNVLSGSTPTYNGSTPTKATSEHYYYTFAGWTPSIATVSADATYTATFSVRELYDIYATAYYNSTSGSATSGTNGSTGGNVYISPNYGWAEVGETVSFTASPATNYDFVGWYSSTTFTSGYLVSSNSSYSTTLGRSNIYLYGFFRIKTYILTVSAGSNGTVSPSGTISVLAGSSQTFTLSPNSGYYAMAVLINGTTSEGISNNSYTLSNITADTTLSFSFAIITYTVSFQAQTYGSVSRTQAVVQTGTSCTFDGNILTLGGITVTATANDSAGQYYYYFTGWSNAPSTITSNVTITASFARTTSAGFPVSVQPGNYHTVIFTVSPGAMITFSGDNVYSNGSLLMTVEPDYVFESITGSCVQSGSKYIITGTTTIYYNAVNYIITFIASPSSYGTVDRTSIIVSPGTTLAAYSENPTGLQNIYYIRVGGTTDVYATPSAATSEYDYYFSSWSSFPSTVTSNITITANFSRSTRYYTITWKNYDGTVLETDTSVAYGATPTYNGSTPTRSSTAQYNYSFSGWSPSVSSVTGNQTYTAQFGGSTRYYTVNFYQYSGQNLLKTQTVAYGGSATAPYQGTRSGYTWNGWDEDFSNVIRNMNVWGTWTQDVVYHTVRFYKYSGGSLLSTQTVAHGGSASAPSYGTRSGYTWNGWDTSYSNITSDTNVYGTWTQNQTTCTISFSSSNNIYGRVSPTSVTVDYSSYIYVSGNTITVGGYTITATVRGSGYFSGWSVSTATEVTGNMNITAYFYDEGTIM